MIYFAFRWHQNRPTTLIHTIEWIVGLVFFIGKKIVHLTNRRSFTQQKIEFVFVSSWISLVLTKRKKNGTLNLNDLYDLLPEYESKQLTESLETNWFDEVKRNKESASLARATIRTMGFKPFLAGLFLLPNVSSFDLCRSKSNWYCYTNRKLPNFLNQFYSRFSWDFSKFAQEFQLAKLGYLSSEQFWLRLQRVQFTIK